MKLTPHRQYPDFRVELWAAVPRLFAKVAMVLAALPWQDTAVMIGLIESVQTELTSNYGHSICVT